MSAEYRQKLVNWFLSIAALFGLIVGSAGIVWYEVTLRLANSYSSQESALFSGLAVGAGYYIFVLPVLLLWHFADFATRGTVAVRWLSVLTDFRFLFRTFCFFGFAVLLSHSSLLYDLFCPPQDLSSGFATLDGCGLEIPLWKSVLVYVPFCTILLVTVLKVIRAVAQIYTRAASRA